MKSKSTDVKFEEALAELEKILDELESAKIPLDEVVSKYVRARECLEVCRLKLDAAELKITQMSADGEETPFVPREQ